MTKLQKLTLEGRLEACGVETSKWATLKELMEREMKLMTGKWPPFSPFFYFLPSFLLLLALLYRGLESFPR
jgi:hypothetical protein